MADDAIEVRVPDIGDFEDVEVIEVLVAPGDRVEVEDSLVTIESDKASMEIPSPHAGVIVEVLVAVGDAVSEGSPLVRLRPEEVARPPSAPAETDRPEAPARAAESAPGPAREPVAERPPGSPPPQPPPVPAAAPPVGSGPVPHASPRVRRFARELGVDLGLPRGSGPHGRILEEDVKAAVRATLVGTGPAASAAPVHHDEADVTGLERFRRAHAEAAREKGLELGLLPFVLKAAALALRAQPAFAAPGVERAHLGVATETPQGLRFPVVRDVDGKGLLELAAELAGLAESADGAEPGAALQVAELDVAGPTPLLAPPSVASLAVGRARIRTDWRDGGPAPRHVLPLSLAWDPRAADAVAAARFVARLRATLGDVARLLL